MVVYAKTDISDRTLPDLAITFSLPFEPAISFPQVLLQESSEIGDALVLLKGTLVVKLGGDTQPTIGALAGAFSDPAAGPDIVE